MHGRPLTVSEIEAMFEHPLIVCVCVCAHRCLCPSLCLCLCLCMNMHQCLSLSSVSRVVVDGRGDVDAYTRMAVVTRCTHITHTHHRIHTHHAHTHKSRHKAWLTHMSHVNDFSDPSLHRGSVGRGRAASSQRKQDCGTYMPLGALTYVAKAYV